uniref:CCHC-type domain-containing protein n=1 Tax=Gadus morhua TaxID=8049 RepID=A0A8C5FEZ9_GADMO
MPKGKGRKKAEEEEKDSNQSPNASERKEQDSFEVEVREIDIYSISETLSRFFNDRHDLQGTEDKLCITYEITMDPQTKRWPKESIWMVFKDWVKKTRRSEPVGLLLLSQCKRYFIKHVSNKKRDELEKTSAHYEDALEKKGEQIKLLADEIRLLKDELTREREQRKLTDLHTTLVREGLIAARPLDSGPSRGGDQGNGGGTLGVYGRMYPTLPSCGPDGEYIFPMQPSSPSGGLQESRQSVLSDVKSFIGEYPVICSTPHVPRKGNPSAPPDYANYDATQIPQQFPPQQFSPQQFPPVQHTLCVSQQFPQFSPVPPHSSLPQQFLHPNPPIQQPPEVRPGAVTKNESRIGGFDDNIQPHCSATGGAATPHIKTTSGEEEIDGEDREGERLRKSAHKRAVSFACLKKVDEKDEIVNLRPLKKIESAEGRTILYEPSSPKDIERWSTEIDHPRRAGLQPWMKLKQLMLLYELHPYDGLAILFKHLSSTQRTQIRYEVEDAMGEDGMRPEKGWEAIKAWIQKHSRAQVNWTTITRCMQKEDEGLDQFNERFFECYLLHSGQTEYDMDTIDQSQDLPLKTMYLQQVLPEIRRGVKTRFPGWDNQSSTMAEIKEFGEKVDRDEEVRIRFLADEKKGMARERGRFPQSNRDRERFPQPDKKREPRPCHNCGQIGHWQRECKAPREMYYYRSNERAAQTKCGNY